MATEQQPAPTILGRSREPPLRSPPAPGESVGAGSSQPIEFRGFEFFSQREHNEYRDASRAYFAEKNGNPASWLGDATPPASAHPSLDESRATHAGFPFPSNQNELESKKKILGLQKPWFWTLLAIIAVIIIVAVGVGVGVGVGKRQAANGSKSASDANLASDGTTTAMSIAGTPTAGGTAMETATSSLTSTRTTTSPTQQSSVPPGSKKNCPAINGTVYEVPGSTKKFLQLCGVDHSKEDGAVDIRNVYTDTVEDCIDNCAGTAGCTGCGWGFIDGDDGPPYRCWLKSHVNEKPHSANMTWHFAVLI